MRSTSILLLSAFLLIGRSTSAQTKTDRTQVQWGDARNDKEHGEFRSVIHRTDDHIFVRVLRKDEMWIQVFSKDLRMLGEREVLLKLGKMEHVLDSILVQGDRTYVFSSVYDKREVTSTLYVRIYSGTDLAPQGALKKVHSASVVTRSLFLMKMLDVEVHDFMVSNRANSDGFQVRENAVGSRQDRTTRRILLFNEDLILEDEVFEEVKLYQTPFASDEFYPEATVYPEDGSKVVVGRKYPEKHEKDKLKRQGKPIYEMVLLVYGPEGQMPEVSTIPSGDRFLQDITMRMLDTGDIICVGFWGDKGSWKVRGAFFMRLDGDNMEVLHESFSQFDDGFITQYMNEKQAEGSGKKGDEIEWLECDLIGTVIRDDGGVFIIAEQYRIRVELKSHETASGSLTSSRTVHYYDNDILVINIDLKGDMEWATKIPKCQYTKNADRRYSSYVLNVKNDNMYFVFNDNGQNLGLRAGDKVHQFDVLSKGAMITLATVDGDGKVHREAVLAPDQSAAILSPQECFQLEHDRVFINAKRKDEYRYGIVTFD